MTPSRPWPSAAASTVVLRGAQVLMIERGRGAMRGVWSFPGGHIEAGETARDAARREVVEETGVTAEVVGLLDVHDVILRDAGGALTAHYVIAVYYAHYVEGEPQAASDAAAAAFVPISDIGRLETTPGAEDFARRAYNLATGASLSVAKPV